MTLFFSGRVAHKSNALNPGVSKPKMPKLTNFWVGACIQKLMKFKN